MTTAKALRLAMLAKEIERLKQQLAVVQSGRAWWQEKKAKNAMS